MSPNQRVGAVFFVAMQRPHRVIFIVLNHLCFHTSSQDRLWLLTELNRVGITTITLEIFQAAFGLQTPKKKEEQFLPQPACNTHSSDLCLYWGVTHCTQLTLPLLYRRDFLSKTLSAAKEDVGSACYWLIWLFWDLTFFKSIVRNHKKKKEGWTEKSRGKWEECETHPH